MDENHGGTAPPNGRVTSRDVIAAVNATEGRITHRIDRIETKMDEQHQRTNERLVVLETEQAIESARWQGAERIVGGLRGFILLLVAVGGLLIGVAGFLVSQDQPDTVVLGNDQAPIVRAEDGSDN